MRKRPKPQHRIRNLRPDDFEQISSVVDDWWGERAVRSLIPRLFFEHFASTSYAVGARGKVIGFLIGFVSPSIPESAYIHFVGVAPEYRGQRLARSLYEAFFDAVAEAQKLSRKPYAKVPNS